MMTEFKPATLYDDYGKKASPTSRGPAKHSFLKSKTHKCEQYDQGICKASKEAIQLGWREEAIQCNGNIPPGCVIQKALADGRNITEILQK